MADDARSDGELLAAAARAEEHAFEELVRRHGTLVYNACLRVLRHAQTAEDGAQAVFLALAHKAGDRALQGRASLAGWLYRTAWHVSLRAKEAQVLQEKHEREAAREQTGAQSDEWENVSSVLDRELNALPEKYRLPIILHHLEGQPAASVGSALNCTEQAIKHRLVRGREMLRERLLRAGVGTNLSVASLATVLTAHAASAALPATFIGVTAKACGLAAVGKSTGTVVSANVNALTKGALKMMIMAKLKVAALVFVAASTVGSALGITAYKALAGEAAKKPEPAVLTATLAPTPSWPGWRGPHRNGTSDETGFEWPKEGPKRIWSVPISPGNGGVAVANGRLFYSGIVDPHGNSQYQAVIGCHDAKTGKELWKISVGSTGTISSHSTPVADDSAVYELNSKGWIGAMAAENGKIIWEKDLVQELSLKDLPSYGIATSPILVGDVLVVGNVALDKKTGKTLWKRPFSSIPSTGLTRIGDKNLLLCLAGENLEAVNVADGNPVWSFNRKTVYGIGMATPLYLDPLPCDDHILFVSGYGGVVISIKDAAVSNAKPQMSYGYSFAQLSLWKGCAIGGESGQGDGNVTGTLACVEIKSGKKLWEHKEYGATHIIVDGKLVIQTLAADLIIAETSTEEYKEISRTPIIERGRPYDRSKGDAPLVTAPAFCDGRIYCRAGTIVCFEVERQKQTAQKK